MSGYNLDEATVDLFEYFQILHLNRNGTRVCLDTDWVLK
jgi:hypothetical protein